MEAYVNKTGLTNFETLKQARNRENVDLENLGTSHLILLAKNLTGYKNLCQLTYIAATQGFYKKPHIDYDILEQYKEGLIVTSACMFGDLSKMVIRKQMDKANEFIARMKSIFGNDFYIEVQNHGFNEQFEFIPQAIKLAKDHNLGLVATNDSHYVNATDWIAQDVLHCVRNKVRILDPDRYVTCRETYMKSRTELEMMFQNGVPSSAFDNTLQIAEKVETYSIQPEHYLIPQLFSTKEKADEALRELCRAGWKKRLSSVVKGNPQLAKIYNDRVKYELDVITSMGFSDYFVIVDDFINAAKSKLGVKVGAGRGSAAGSLVSYLCKITNLDPIKYKLLFERFLVPGRPTMPDIDIDVSDRDAIIAYLKSKYGEECVAPIINRVKASSKMAISRVGTVMGMHQEAQAVSDIIEQRRGKTPTIAESLKEFPLLQIEKNRNPLLFQYAEAIEDVTVQVSGHASGVVVASQPIRELVPTYRAHDELYTAYDKNDISYAKLVKFDILGVDVLKAIDKCCQLIKQRHNIDLDPDSLVPDDPAVYQTICKGDLIGVFQFESDLMRGIIKQIKPSNLFDLALVNAMGRPGALDNPILIPTIAACKAGTQEIVYPHPSLKPILEETFGLPIYQEQIMKISQLIAGFSIIDADKFRKGCSDKKVEIIEALRPKFIEGSVKNGYSQELATSLFEQSLLFAGYGFNKGHAMAYAYVAYQTAYLKTYYPMEFLTAYLNTMIDRATELEDITKLVMDCELHNITIGPLDVNKSEEYFKISTELDKNGQPIVYYGLGGIKGVNISAIHEWLKLRPFINLDDAMVKSATCSLGMRELDALSQVGAFSSIAPNTTRVLQTLDDRNSALKKTVARYKKAIAKQEKDTDDGQLGMFVLAKPELIFSFGDNKELLLEASSYEHTRLINAQRELMGLSVSGSLLDEYSETVKSQAEMLTTFFIHKVEDGKEAKVAGVITYVDIRKDKNGNNMAFLRISDGRSDIRVLVFASLFERFSAKSWREGNAIVADGRKDGRALIARQVHFLRKDKPDHAITEQEVKSKEVEF
jgi:DNA polymerase-3 subunit alpha